MDLSEATDITEAERSIDRLDRLSDELREYIRQLDSSYESSADTDSDMQDQALEDMRSYGK